jgi:hypothetical protein
MRTSMRPAGDKFFLRNGIYASLFFREIQAPGEDPPRAPRKPPAMNAALPSPSSSVARASARDRQFRRVRILAPVQAGYPVRRSRARHDGDAPADENWPNREAALDAPVSH